MNDPHDNAADDKAMLDRILADAEQPARPVPAGKRKCYYIPPDQRDEEGYIPSLVIEDEPGHTPFRGNGPCASPWHWGRTYEQARDLAAEMNRKDFGLDEMQVAAIMISSIRASRRAGRTGDYVKDAL